MTIVSTKEDAALRRAGGGCHHDIIRRNAEVLQIDECHFEIPISVPLGIYAHKRNLHDNAACEQSTALFCK